MPAGFFAPDGANAVASRPADASPSIEDGWCRDVSAPGAGNGTVVTATLLNQIIANLRSIVTTLGGASDGSDDMLVGALLAGLLSKGVYDPNAVAGDAFDMGNMIEAADAKVLSAAERAILSYLTVTSATDLDAIRQRVAELDATVVLRGEWDASAGTFPGEGGAQTGDSWLVSVAGVVDSIDFQINDRIIAITDDASTTTYATYWIKADYSDLVTSIEGQTGAITLAAIGAAALASPALTGTPTAPTQSPGDNSTKIATTAYADAASSLGAPGLVYGLKLSNGTDAAHDIDIGIGQTVSDDLAQLIKLTSGLTKQLDATFAEGTNQGGMVSGESMPTSGCVHAWAIRKDDGTVDVCFNNHASSGLSPTLPTGFTTKNYIGSLRTNGSATLYAFKQTGDYIDFDVPLVAYHDTNIDAAASNVTNTRTLPVPVGFRCFVNADMSGGNNASDFMITFYAADSTGDAAARASVGTPDAGRGSFGCRSNAAGNSSAAAQRIVLRTSTAAQIKDNVFSGSNDTCLKVVIIGYWCPRGRLIEAI